MKFKILEKVLNRQKNSKTKNSFMSRTEFWKLVGMIIMPLAVLDLAFLGFLPDKYLSWVFFPSIIGGMIIFKRVGMVLDKKLGSKSSQTK